ncbi:MAG: hypothetical protein ACYDC2_03660 [Solirubrobacteraceae bacterium]
MTKHGSSSPPQNALDLLGELIAGRREDAYFKRAGSYISARLDREVPIAMTQDERTEIGRRVVLEIIGDVCDRTPGMKLEWYAVGAGS